MTNTSAVHVPVLLCRLGDTLTPRKRTLDSSREEEHKERERATLTASRETETEREREKDGRLRLVRKSVKRSAFP